jgi:hypothetical protein
LWIICLGWLRTAVLLMSGSQVARITGMGAQQWSSLKLSMGSPKDFQLEGSPSLEWPLPSQNKSDF